MKYDNIPDTWSIKTISEIAETTSGGTPNRSRRDFYINGIYPWIKTGELKNKYLYDSEEYITEEAVNNSSAKLIKTNSVIIAMYGATIGKMAINKVEVTTNQACCSISCKNEIYDYEFLFYILSLEKENIIKLGAGGAQPNINQEIIRSYKILCPPIDEQRRVVEVLSTWDLAIEKQEQLIEKKKEFKKGLMQRLLSGEVRFKEFKDEWNNKTLENYILPVSRECDKPNEGYWRLGLRSHGKGTFHEFVEDPSKISMDKLYKVKCNDLIVNITFAWEHAIAVANSMDQDKLVSHRFPTYEFKENAYPIFFKYYILQPKFKHMLVNISPGGAGRNRVMSKKDFLKLIVKVPSYDEQVRIAEVLIELDKEIELLQKELEALKLQKKGLMQRLLTGEVRVKID